MKKISFIIPSRNNLNYLKWSYESIRKNLNLQHEICVADDFSDDGTHEWCKNISKGDGNFKFIRNNGPTRLGHTILYDKLINIAANDIVMIYHADMYACPGLDEAILRYIKPGMVVSATRIEPPLHPPGPEKILQSWGNEPEEFDEDAARDFTEDFKVHYKDKITNGTFAPWAIFKSDFQNIGGHDSLFAPQSREDSDIFNRFILAGYNLIQTWEGFVYHLTCRGSRFNPNITKVGIMSDEWKTHNIKSERNFIRKWGTMVMHDEHLLPIVNKKFKISYLIKNILSLELFRYLEPYATDKIYLDIRNVDLENYPNFPQITKNFRDEYIKLEQSNTKFNLSDKITVYEEKEGLLDYDILVEFDVNKFEPIDIQNLVAMQVILANNKELGEYSVGNLIVRINSLETYEKNLIKCNQDYIYY